MIKNIIQGFDFEKAGIECICQSINILFQVYKDSNEFLKDEIISSEVTMDEVWEHHYVSINTSFILLHQGLEAILKWKVCEESPLLLLDQIKSDWPTLPSSKEIEFNEMHQIGGINLINTFFAVNKNPLLNTNEFYKLIEDIRKIRNEIVHVKPKDNILASESIVFALKILTAFYEKDKWIEFLRDRYINNPLLGYSDPGAESAMFFERLIFIISTIGKGNLNEFVTVNLKARAYCCPKCSYDLSAYTEDIKTSKLSFLKPNTPESDNIYCLICGQEYRIKRIKCELDGCKGNVFNADELYNDCCLTCLRIE